MRKLMELHRVQLSTEIRTIPLNTLVSLDKVCHKKIIRCDFALTNFWSRTWCFVHRCTSNQWPWLCTKNEIKQANTTIRASHMAHVVHITDVVFQVKVPMEKMTSVYCIKCIPTETRWVMEQQLKGSPNGFTFTFTLRESRTYTFTCPKS